MSEWVLRLERKLGEASVERIVGGVKCALVTAFGLVAGWRSLGRQSTVGEATWACAIFVVLIILLILVSLAILFPPAAAAAAAAEEGAVE